MSKCLTVTRWPTWFPTKKEKVADMEVDMVAYVNIDIDMEIQFGERVGHGGWLIGPKLF